MRFEWKRAWYGLLVAAAAAVVQPVLAASEAHGEPNLIAPPSAGIIPAITTLVVFVALVAILGKYAWGPIATGLRAREDKIRKDIADAEAASSRAQATLTEYKAQLATAEMRVREMMNNAMAEGEKLAAGIRLRAQQEAEEIKTRATREIDAARKQALADIYAQAAELSTSIAEKILRRNINSADQQQLV